MSITFSDVHHAYSGVEVLHDICLDVAEQEIVCVLGPSGSGKSTLLKLVAGLEWLQRGEITLAGQRITPETCPPPESRPIGLVLQEHALFPHLTVRQNLEFGLSGHSPAERQSRTDLLLRQTGLADLDARYPGTLSGGQQQRVALARSLAPSPQIMLMDEPFASVDVLLKEHLRGETRRLLAASGATTLMVTHDPADALAIADRIAVIVDGRLVQCAAPETMWHTPAHPFVAEVLAGRQLVSARRDDDDGVFLTAFGAAPIESVTAPAPSEPRVCLAIDPYDVELARAPESEVVIRDIRFAGRDFVILLAAGEETLQVRTVRPLAFGVGDAVSVRFASGTIPAYNRE